MKSKIIFTISLGLLFQISVNAQEKETLNFASYLSEVREKNLNYAAQKYNVSMTEASILTAGLFPDPQLEMETSDNGVSKKMGVYDRNFSKLDFGTWSEKKSKDRNCKKSG
ncbi:hypothetical protein [Chryseobacterium carnipullorum]|uniref:TolC family protein n=1 Tax=Chryseobacterium carnipullorum TaxID=1124835 RepID=A0A376DP63_CHRCU|nr:hypothetical protein [Chryseobacterium carnipullorum]STC92873.1 Uncharacterised protein [Chryseobacterium carnipullorum]